MQLSGTHPRLTHALFSDTSKHLLVSGSIERLPNLPLVVRLPAHPDKPAGLRHAYSNSFLSFERTPKGFFGTDTPYSVLMMSSIDSNSWAFKFASFSCLSSSLIRCSGVCGRFSDSMRSLFRSDPPSLCQSSCPCFLNQTSTVERP